MPAVADPRDPLEALDRREAGEHSYSTPGHKGRVDLTGTVVAGDLCLYGGLDTVKLHRGVLAEAERRAARLWGADVCRFSVGGSTHGNQALVLAVARPGEEVVVSRTGRASRGKGGPAVRPVLRGNVLRPRRARHGGP